MISKKPGNLLDFPMRRSAHLLLSEIKLSVQAMGLLREFLNQRNFAKMNLMMASIVSYWILAPSHPQGFEIALGVHIFLIIIQFIETYQRMKKTPNPLVFPSAMFLLSCLMFVVPKLLDHYLAEQFPSLFGTLTGHFWSKIGDFMQIHYAQIFFLTAERYKSFERDY